jgi:excinuclease ABC subunit C
MSLPEHNLSHIVKNLPDSPGIYQYFDNAGVIIYVGKAKSLKKRVANYFNRDGQLDRKTYALVKNIVDIKFILVETELEALLLENTLIKKHQPKYNVLLKDDKTFPCIMIKNEEFPRVYPIRQIVKDGSNYFGPYASSKMMYTMLDLIKELYPLRNCNLNLAHKNIVGKKYKVCLEYHMGNCKGPCEGKQSKEDYDNSIYEIKQILKGNLGGIIRNLKSNMLTFASNFEYEKAQEVKLKMELLENYRSKSTVVSTTIDNVDVISIMSDEDYGYINYLKMVSGAIVQGHTIELKKKLNETDVELLQIGFAELRARFNSQSPEIIVPFDPQIELSGITFTVPLIGDKKKLLELSTRNVLYYRKEKQKQNDLIDPERHTKRILAQMTKDLRLLNEPRHIECFDNSNIQGSYPVAAMTVFKDLKPSKKDYRHFNIKTVEGPDDFASMEEIIYRRYKRMLEEQQPVPDLIVIDGGKGQLSAALHSLETLGLRGKMSIIGIAKKLEEIYYPGDSLPLYLDKKGETLKVLQHIRDEAHRFGITHHRNKRSKGTIKTELTEIKGISNTTANKLLLEFKSVKQIKETKLSDIENAIGKAKGKLVFDYFHNADIKL